MHVRAYYELVKPGIIYGNAITATAGFVLASGPHVPVLHLGAMLVGLSCVIGAGCVYNNYLDRAIDKHMPRTAHRLFVEGGYAPPILAAATLAGCAGLGLLWEISGPLAALIALAALVVYVGIYTALAKPRTPYATHIGAFAGAAPPVIGYVAVTGELDLAALILFLTLFLWQLAHFFAIALYRSEEYRAAGIPVLPLVHGERVAWSETILYIVLCGVAAYTLVVAGYAPRGYGYAVIALTLGWLASALVCSWRAPIRRAARGVFFASLVVLIGIFGTLVVGTLCR